MHRYNGILIVDKPAGFTSHDVIAKLRGLLNMRRIGHAGTLDPMATGVLPIFLGRATKAASFLAAADKAYVAEFLLGVRTTTQDTDGETLSCEPVSLDRERLLSALARFRGEIEQIPPMYSAVKINGQPLHKLARRGLVISRPARRVVIHEIRLNAFDGSKGELFVAVSKGTYIRTLVADLGECLGCGTVLTALRRVRSGAFSIAQAIPLEAIEDMHPEEISAQVVPVGALFGDCPAVHVLPEYQNRMRNGAFLTADMVEDFPVLPARYRVYTDGEFVMLGKLGQTDTGAAALFCEKMFGIG